MINPSAPGWIDKFLTSHKAAAAPYPLSEADFYRSIRQTGFVYGYVVQFNTTEPIAMEGLTSEEISKIALLHTLYKIFTLPSGQSDPEVFIEKAVSFYKDMHPEGYSWFKKVLPENTSAAELEKMIDARVQTNDNIISRNFSHILTNALLFEDVLAFRQYLIHGAIPQQYLKKLEEALVSIVSLALHTKSNKSEYDDLLTKLFEASVRFTKFSKVNAQNLEALELDFFVSDLEKFYLLDLAVLAIWYDQDIDPNETQFLEKLGRLLSVDQELVQESIRSTDRFIKQYKDEIPYFNYSNPVKHFYDHAAQTVALLITRNKNRLLKELSNNGELVLLLTHSTHRSLEDKEKKKIKKQLLEICKTIPSLTIFLLPGGSLLLPLLIKFIPKMLPSVFNENLEGED